MQPEPHFLHRDWTAASPTKPTETETENASNRETDRDTDGQSHFSSERMVDKRPMATLVQPGSASTNLTLDTVVGALDY